MKLSNDIKKLIDLFERRGAYLSHACQLLDFESYLKFGSITSPAELERAKLPHSAFFNGSGYSAAWSGDWIRLSMTDVGAFFAHDTRRLPNPHGPLLLQFKPEVLAQATEIVIGLEPAAGFTTFPDALLTLNDAPYLFRYTEEAPFPEKTHVKGGTELAKGFNVSPDRTPEIFCRFGDAGIKFEWIASAFADNYLILKRQLRDWTTYLGRYHGFDIPTQRRYCPADIGGYLSDRLAICLLEKEYTLKALAHDSESVMADWAGNLLGKDMEAPFGHFAKRLREGTLLPLQRLADRLLKVTGVSARQNVSKGDSRMISQDKRNLIAKLAAEDISQAVIARIVELPQEQVHRWIEKKE